MAFSWTKAPITKKKSNFSLAFSIFLRVVDKRNKKTERHYMKIIPHKRILDKSKWSWWARKKALRLVYTFWSSLFSHHLSIWKRNPCTNQIFKSDAMKTLIEKRDDAFCLPSNFADFFNLCMCDASFLCFFHFYSLYMLNI